MKIIFSAVFYFVAVIIIAHVFAPSEYIWSQNTISDLAAQGLEYQWIMQIGFIGFGLLLNIGLVRKFVRARQIFYPDVPLMLYGLAILLTGFFSTKPFLEGVNYSTQEHFLHSLFAQVAGISFSLGIFWCFFKSSRPKEKLFHVIFFALVIGTSLLFGLAEDGLVPLGKGVAQRLLYLTSFIWLLTSHSGQE